MHGNSITSACTRRPRLLSARHAAVTQQDHPESDLPSRPRFFNSFLGKSKYGIVAGDFNCVPPGDPEPPWDEMPTRRRAQAIPADDGVRADRRVGERLARAGLRDAARDYAMSTSTGGPEATGDWYRCDQIWVTPTIRVHRLETVDTGLSDHRLIVAELELPGPDLEREIGA